jgi:hypothetical protein
VTSPLATIEELEAVLPFVMDDGERREATGALNDLSDEARHYGNPRWDGSDDANPTAKPPYSITNLVLKAARRHMKNYEGFISSRAGDEAVGWTDRKEDAGSATFTREERERIKIIGGNQRSGFHSVDMFSSHKPGTTPTMPGLVPAEGSSNPVHMFSSDTEPW